MLLVNDVSLKLDLALNIEAKIKHYELHSLRILGDVANIDDIQLAYPCTTIINSLKLENHLSRLAVVVCGSIQFLTYIEVSLRDK